MRLWVCGEGRLRRVYRISILKSVWKINIRKLFVFDSMKAKYSKTFVNQLNTSGVFAKFGYPIEFFRDLWQLCMLVQLQNANSDDGWYTMGERETFPLSALQHGNKIRECNVRICFGERRMEITRGKQAGKWNKIREYNFRACLGERRMEMTRCKQAGKSHFNIKVTCDASNKKTGHILCHCAYILCEQVCLHLNTFLTAAVF